MQTPEPADIHSESFLRRLMRQQLRLSILNPATFLAMLLGLPLANYLLPDLMARRMFGFTLSWLILGLGFFPAVWILSWLFIRRSIALEEREVREARAVDSSPRPVMVAVGNR